MMERTFLIEILLVCYLHDSFGICATEDTSACEAGKFGNGCQYNCSSSCNFNKCIISPDKGIPECDGGCKEYYTGIFCQEFCPSLCLKCNQTRGTCNKCIDGYYGVTCNQTCDEDCLNGTCDIDGICVLAPKSGVRIKLKSANSEGQCLKMTEDGSVCQCCRMGRRGDNCEQVCENCHTYYIPNKVCRYLCKDGYYGQTCTEECPKFCHRGHSGKPLCESTYDVLRCMNGCKRGYTGLQCSNKCSNNCRSDICYQMDGICLDCPNGKHGDMCFDTCSLGCVNETCSRNGTCTDGCKTGMFGRSCNKTCPETCSTCRDDINTGVANCFSDCKTGYHGSLCQDKCNEGCKGNTCNKVDGSCVRGCKPGYHDLRCHKKCSEGCQDNSCYIEDGNCHRGCKRGFYRDNCTGICGINCLNNKCEDQYDGANPNVTFLCSEGCKSGYKGRSCNQMCPKHCMFCKQLSDDICMKCVDGYNLTSDEDGNLSCLKTDPELAMSHANIIIICIVCTTVFSIIIITLIIYMLKRRKRSSFNPLLRYIYKRRSHTEKEGQVNNVETESHMKEMETKKLDSRIEDRKTMEPLIKNRSFEQDALLENRRTMDKEPITQNRTMDQESSTENRETKEKESNVQGNNRLIKACRTGKLRVVKRILKHPNININARGRHGMTPIMEATQAGCTKVIDVLLKNGCDLSAVADDNNTVLHVACDRGNIDLVKDILDKKLFNINAKGNMERSPLMIAAMHGNKNLFDLLKREGADVNTRDCSNDTILHVACFNKNEAFIKHLLMLGCIDINVKGCKGRTPGLLAAYCGHRGMFDLFYGQPWWDKSTRDHNNDTVLHVACYNDNEEFVKYLLTLRVFDIECKGCKGRSPAMIAAKNGCRKVFQILVKGGCDLEVRDERRDNILTLACCNDNVAFVEYLLTLNTFDINTKGNKGRTPLLVAAGKGCRKVFTLLAKNGGDLSAKDDNGDSISSLGDFEEILQR